MPLFRIFVIKELEVGELLIGGIDFFDQYLPLERGQLSVSLTLPKAILQSGRVHDYLRIPTDTIVQFIMKVHRIYFVVLLILL